MLSSLDLVVYNRPIAISNSIFNPFYTAVPNCCCSKGLSPYGRPYRSNLPFLIVDIRALWSTRALECQKLKMVGYTTMAKCKALTGSAVKGLSLQCTYSVSSNTSVR